MARKITKNLHQYKTTIPIDLMDRLNWDENTEIEFKEVSTDLGNGILILKSNNNAMKLRVKK